MQILHLITSPRGQASQSIQLGQAIVDRLQQAHPGSTLVVRNLAQHPFPHLEEAHIQSFYTPPEQRTPQQAQAVKHSDEAIAELFAADVLVIGAPMYNFNISSTLKSWLDHIARARITFRYTNQGPEGLIKGKQVYIAIASGGVYSQAPLKAVDFMEPYLRYQLGFMGIDAVKVFRVEGLQIPDLQETALARAIDSIEL